MKNLQLKNRFDSKDAPRSLFSTPVSHRVFAVLFLLLVAGVTIASTTRGTSVSSGANLILAPGKPGLEPAFY
jgi:hypothetical protein